MIYQIIRKFLSAEITFDLDLERRLSVLYVNWEDQKLLNEGVCNKLHMTGAQKCGMEFTESQGKRGRQKRP